MGFFDRAPLAERQAEGKVARLRAYAAQDQVAEAGEAGERLAAGAEGAAEPRQFGEAAGGERQPLPATMPAAMASTFLAAPPISTPRTSVE